MPVTHRPKAICSAAGVSADHVLWATTAITANAHNAVRTFASKALTNLQDLNLTSSQVTNAGLVHLKTLSNL